MKVAPCERSFINIPSRMFSLEWSYIIPALHCASVQYPYAPVPHHDTCWSPVTRDTYRSCTIVHSDRHWLQACSPSIIHCPSPALLCWPYDVTFELCKVKGEKAWCHSHIINLQGWLHHDVCGQHSSNYGNMPTHKVTVSSTKTTRLHAHWTMWATNTARSTVM